MIIPPTGARLILASDGLWDALAAGRLAKALRNSRTPADAARMAVGLAIQVKQRLADDTSVLVVDILPHSGYANRSLLQGIGHTLGLVDILPHVEVRMGLGGEWNRACRSKTAGLSWYSRHCITWMTEERAVRA